MSPTFQIGHQYDIGDLSDAFLYISVNNGRKYM